MQLQDTNFYRTAQINNLAGNYAAPTDYAGHRKQLDLIASEIKEGRDHLPNMKINPDALRDDVQDVLFTTYGLAHRLGLTADQVLLDDAKTNYETCKGWFDDTHDVSTDPYNWLNRVEEAHHHLLMTHVQAEAAGLVPKDDEGVTEAVENLLVEAYGLGLALGYPVDVDYNEVVRSNMTKFDRIQADVLATQDKYAQLGVETVVRTAEHTLSNGEVVILFVTKSAKDQVGTDGKDYPADKWLKSVNFEEPQYAPRTTAGHINLARTTPTDVSDKCIRITVLGGNHTGKSHVSALLAKVLSENGFSDVTLVDQDGVDGALKALGQMNKISSLSALEFERPQIIITQGVDPDWHARRIAHCTERRLRGEITAHLAIDDSPDAEGMDSEPSNPQFASQGFAK